MDNWRITRLVQRKEPDPYKIEAVQDRGADVAGYVASYLLPFLAVPEPSGRELLAYGVFLGVVGLIYVRSEMVQINPVLYVLGRRLSLVRTSEGWTAFLIARHMPEVGDAIEAVSLRSTVLVRAEEDGANG